MQLPSPRTDNTTICCKKAVVQLLDHSFCHFLAGCTEGLDGLLAYPAMAGQGAIIQALAFLAQSYDFKDFWQRQRCGAKIASKGPRCSGHVC